MSNISSTSFVSLHPSCRPVKNAPILIGLQSGIPTRTAFPSFSVIAPYTLHTSQPLTYRFNTLGHRLRESIRILLGFVNTPTFLSKNIHEVIKDTVLRERRTEARADVPLARCIRFLCHVQLWETLGVDT